MVVEYVIRLVLVLANVLCSLFIINIINYKFIACFIFFFSRLVMLKSLTGICVLFINGSHVSLFENMALSMNLVIIIILSASFYYSIFFTL